MLLYQVRNYSCLRDDKPTKISSILRLLCSNIFLGNHRKPLLLQFPEFGAINYNYQV